MTRRPAARADTADLTGRSRAIARVREQIRHLAGTRANVLIEGGPGTGKRRAARALHRESPRRHGPFVTLDLGAAPAAAIERELFGAEDADAEPRAGALERGDGGTLVLAEAGALPAPAQVRLLRFLQHHAFERVGGRDARRADVRIVAVARAPLEAEVRAGRFREDLLVRLGVGRIVMPALAERAEDVPALVERFVREANREHHRKVAGATPGVIERLTRHPWPGNVRELEATIERMVIAAHGRRPLGIDDLPPGLSGAAEAAPPLAMAVGMTVAEVEARLIAATLAATAGDKRRAAALLGIGLRTLYRKIGRRR
ncbi:MAG: sigma-54-dependent Fis family transcriptional regulator [Candidatus Eisenbacteria bacterium]|uniref:Sigma-54-dependent Fis family transcriptional regulator n=1 Tax=Eiseniibacteriota bacterium TaxID=2212470 RepID=A0A9D6L859_UNCEI|nr:sigma-54-dependent Fis family transcriptional regulator [Candidatus Eisenbacteria bacterium]MBI3539400.1 sigma-54-dependent Fis family transcriptional regulator [Candidatus Eisenbacteria bacterium]